MSDPARPPFEDPFPSFPPSWPWIDPPTPPGKDDKTGNDED